MAAVQIPGTNLEAERPPVSSEAAAVIQVKFRGELQAGRDKEKDSRATVAGDGRPEWSLGQMGVKMGGKAGVEIELARTDTPPRRGAHLDTKQSNLDR